MTIPFAVMEPYVGPIPDATGQAWRGNFFKCGSEISHPHWASWFGDRIRAQFSSAAILRRTVFCLIAFHRGDPDD